MGSYKKMWVSLACIVAIVVLWRTGLLFDFKILAGTVFVCLAIIYWWWKS